MEHPGIPVAMMPPVYELPLAIKRWCRLNEVCQIVPNVARLADNNFAPTAETLVHHFAGLAKSNLTPTWKKMFHYSVDGRMLMATEVPMREDCFSFPPYKPFFLDVGLPYPDGLLVSEVWACDTLNAIRDGAIAVADFGDMKVRFTSSGVAFRFDANPVRVIVRVPSFAHA